MLPLLQKELVEKKEWLDTETLMDYYAIGQSTPGIIAVNTATFTGYSRKRVPGAIFATLGIITPSIIIIVIVASVLTNFIHIEAVGQAFDGIRVAVAALVIVTVMDLFKKTIVDWLCVLIFVVSFILSLLTNISPVYIVVSAAITGLILGNRMRDIRVRKRQWFI